MSDVSIVISWDERVVTTYMCMDGGAKPKDISEVGYKGDTRATADTALTGGEVAVPAYAVLPATVY